MKIISKFHDYYDIARVGIDKTRVFNRETSFVSEGKHDLFHEYKPFVAVPRNTRMGAHDIRFGIVGFCGTIHPFVNVEDNRYYNYFDMVGRYPHLFDGTASISERDVCRYRLGLDGIASWFHADFGYFHKFFDKYAYFSCENTYDVAMRIYFYPLLKELQFFRVFDPYSCYQAIEMFVCNNLAPRDTMKILPISDKLKAESHGFNKFSFRKDKSE